MPSRRAFRSNGDAGANVPSSWARVGLNMRRWEAGKGDQERRWVVRATILQESRSASVRKV